MKNNFDIQEWNIIASLFFPLSLILSLYLYLAKSIVQGANLIWDAVHP